MGNGGYVTIIILSHKRGNVCDPPGFQHKNETVTFREKGGVDKRFVVSLQSEQTHGPPLSVHCTDALEEMKILSFHIRPTEAGILGLGCRLEFNKTPLRNDSHACPCYTATL